MATPRHYGEFSLLWAMQSALRLLPRNVAIATGAAAGALLRQYKAQLPVVQRNLDHVGLFDPSLHPQIIDGLYRNTGRYFADILHNRGRMPPCRVNGASCLDDSQAKGKGTVIVLGHLGGWEMMAAIFGKTLANLHVIAKKMRNPLVEQWLDNKRLSTGVTTVYSDKALRKMIEVIRANGLVAILIDQNARQMGTTVPFLGKPASTVRSVAGLVQKTGCSVVTGYALILPDNSYQVHFEPISDVGVDPTDESRFVEAHQAEHNRVLSEFITRYPEHYFGWFHRRFRGHIEY